MLDERYNPLKVVRWAEEIIETLQGGAGRVIRANLDLTDLCNHKCSWCEPLPFRKENIRGNKHTLPLPTALDVLDDLAALGCSAVYFSGGGEPTLHKSFGEILAHAKNLGMRTLVITNGSMWWKWRERLETYADHVRVSVDASNHDEHQAIHGSKAMGFRDLLLGVKFTVDHSKPRRPEIGFSYVLEPRNWSWGSVLEIMTQAHRIKIDYLQFRPCSTEKIDKSMLDGLFAAIEKEAPKICPEVKVLTFGWRNSDVLYQREFERCYSSITVPVIGANGDVSACCDRRDVVFGNVRERRLKDIWLGEEHRKKAASISPKLCQRCLQCGMNRAVEKYVVNNEALLEMV